MEIDLPFILRQKTRHGRAVLYVRIGKGRRIRLRTPADQTEAFMAEYNAAREQLAAEALGLPRPQDPQQRRIAAGSMDALVKAYLRAFRRDRAAMGKAFETRAGVLRAAMDEPIEPGSPYRMGGCPVAAFTSRHVRVLRDRKAGKPGAAANRLKYLSALFTWAIEQEQASVNPVRDVKRPPAAGKGFHTLTRDELRQYFEHHGPGTTARRALALMFFAFVRPSDARRLGRMHRTPATPQEPQGRLEFVPAKRANNAGLRPDLRQRKVSIVIGPELAAELDATPTGQMLYVLNEYGKPFTEAGFVQRCRKWFDAAGLPHASAHGGRKAANTIAAEEGATTRELMAASGHVTEKESTTYTRAADEKRLAARAAARLKL